MHRYLNIHLNVTSFNHSTPYSTWNEMLFCGIGIEHIQRPSIELAKAAAVRYLRLNPALMAAGLGCAEKVKFG